MFKQTHVLKINQLGGRQEANDRIRKVRSIGVYAERFRLEDDHFNNSIAHPSSVLLHDSCVHCVVVVECVAWLELVRIECPDIAYKCCAQIRKQCWCIFKCLNRNDPRTTLLSLTQQPASNPSEQVGRTWIRRGSEIVLSLKSRRGR